MPSRSPLAVVHRQFDAYNARDIEALLATYSEDAEQFMLHGPCLAKGHAAIRERFLLRFAEPDLQARLLSRQVMTDVVVDLELITRNFPEGRGTIEMLCIYEVVDGLIRKASFATGKKTLLTEDIKGFDHGNRPLIDRFHLRAGRFTR